MTLLKLNVILAVTVVIFSTSHTAANKDVKLALSGSAPYGILNQHFVFTCTVSNAAAADQYFVYLRCSKTVYKYHCIWQVGDECRQSPTFMPAWIRDRYYSVCGYGIKKPKSNVRKYQFVIKSVTKMDRNQWWCEMQGLTYKKNSNTIILTVHPFKVALSASAPYGILNQRFVFTCTVSNAATVDNYFVNLRRSNSGYKYHRIWQTGDECRQSPTIMPTWIHDRYYSVCGYGTKKPKSNVRKYQFVIKSVTKMDRNQWWCLLNISDIYHEADSNTINLTVQFLKVSLRMTSSAPVLGKPLTLICEVENTINLNATVQFIKRKFKKASVVGILHQEHSKCSQIGDTTRGYNPKCGIATNRANSNIKLYVMEIARVSSHDSTEWICSIKTPDTDQYINNSLIFRLTLWQGTLYQHYDKCKISKDTFRGYTAKCGKGTDSGPSDTKVYVIEIAKLSLRDNGVWFCYVQDEESSKSVTSRSFKICSPLCDHGTLQQYSCTCDCEKPWIGEECEICNLQCKHGRVRNDTCTCDCGEYWTGENCEIHVCNLHCDHGILLQDSCTCVCEKHWIGEECEICNIQCTHGRVHNDTCTCDCGEYWTGENCGTEIKKSDRNGPTSAIKVPERITDGPSWSYYSSCRAFCAISCICCIHVDISQEETLKSENSRSPEINI
ncbi:uncharacterized protein LOC121386622 isoform X2 [Gigantopelta aegis]|uniref:uncharacterized protein LOC121386622 isoform X2 n=1 Tax=Gigantopelta aegis TaxID=1735272 RepID=UPI001B8882D3|nr:uncharacterized protein LOC121386622 isoform X2 [Gigantopelta aegis]